MAKIIYDIYKVTNPTSRVVNRFFGRTVHTETLDTEGLARHIMEHGSPYTDDIVEGVLKKAEKCILEVLLDSKKVKLNGLGTLYCTLQNKKGGAATVSDFSINKNVKGLRIRFLPDLSANANLSSKALAQKANFRWAEDLRNESAEERPEPEP